MTFTRDPELFPDACDARTLESYAEADRLLEADFNGRSSGFKRPSKKLKSSEGYKRTGFYGRVGRMVPRLSSLSDEDLSAHYRAMAAWTRNMSKPSRYTDKHKYREAKSKMVRNKIRAAQEIKRRREKALNSDGGLNTQLFQRLVRRALVDEEEQERFLRQEGALERPWGLVCDLEARTLRSVDDLYNLQDQYLQAFSNWHTNLMTDNQQYASNAEKQEWFNTVDETPELSSSDEEMPDHVEVDQIVVSTPKLGNLPDDDLFSDDKRPSPSLLVDDPDDLDGLSEDDSSEDSDEIPSDPSAVEAGDDDENGLREIWCDDAATYGIALSPGGLSSQAFREELEFAKVNITPELMEDHPSMWKWAMQTWGAFFQTEDPDEVSRDAQAFFLWLGLSDIDVEEEESDAIMFYLAERRLKVAKTLLLHSTRAAFELTPYELKMLTINGEPERPEKPTSPEPPSETHNPVHYVPEKLHHED